MIIKERNFSHLEEIHKFLHLKSVHFFLSLKKSLKNLKKYHLFSLVSLQNLNNNQTAVHCLRMKKILSMLICAKLKVKLPLKLI